MAEPQLTREEIEQRLDEISASLPAKPHNEYLKAEIVRLKNCSMNGFPEG
jgi:hypothetical protein